MTDAINPADLGRLLSAVNRRPSPWFTVKESSEYLRSSERQIRRYIDDKHLKANRLPTGSIRVHIADLDSFIMYGKNSNKLTRPQRVNINTKRLIWLGRDE